MQIQPNSIVNNRLFVILFFYKDIVDNTVVKEITLPYLPAKDDEIWVEDNTNNKRNHSILNFNYNLYKVSAKPTPIIFENNVLKFASKLIKE